MCESVRRACVALGLENAHCRKVSCRGEGGRSGCNVELAEGMDAKAWHVAVGLGDAHIIQLTPHSPRSLPHCFRAARPFPCLNLLITFQIPCSSSLAGARESPCATTPLSLTHRLPSPHLFHCPPPSCLHTLHLPPHRVAALGLAHHHLPHCFPTARPFSCSDLLPATSNTFPKPRPHHVAALWVLQKGFVVSLFPCSLPPFSLALPMTSHHHPVPTCGSSLGGATGSP